MSELISVGTAFTVKDSLSKSVANIQKSLTATGGKMRETQTIADNGGKKGGIFHNLIEGAKLFTLSNINSKVQDINDALAGSQSGFNDTFKTLDELRQKLGFAFDPKAADAYNRKVLEVMSTTGLTGDATETLAEGMLQYGRSLKEASEVLPMMGEMVGVLGMEAGKVAEIWGSGLASLRATPKQIASVIKETVRLQKGYNLTNQVENLPEIFENVTKNSALFGKVNTQMSLNTVRGMANVSAAFQKTGMSQQKAMATTLGLSDSLSAMRRSYEDMLAGEGTIDPKLFKVADAFSFAGKDGDEIMNKIINGMNPEDLVKEIQGALKGLDAESTSVVAAKLRTALGDDIMHLAQGFPDELAKNMDTKGMLKDVAPPEEAFDKFTAAMKNSVKFQDNLTDSMKALVDIQTDFANKDKMIVALKAQQEALRSFSEEVQKAESLFGKIIKTIKLYNEVGISGIFPELAPYQKFFGLATNLLSPLLGLVGAFHLLKFPLDLVGGLFGTLSGKAGAVEKAVGKSSKLTSAFGWLKGQLLWLHTFVGVKAIDAFAKLSSVVGRMLSPFAALRGALGETKMAFKMAFGEGVSQILTHIKDFGAKALSGMTGWIKAAVTRFGSLASHIKTLGGIVSKFIAMQFGSLGSHIKTLGGIFSKFTVSIATQFGSLGSHIKTVGGIFSKFTGIIASAGQKIPGLANGVKALSGMTGWIKAAMTRFGAIGARIKTVGSIVSKFTGFIASAGQKISGLANVFTRFMKVADFLKSAINLVTFGLRAFNLTLLANPIALVIASVVLLGVGIYALVKNWDTVKEATMSFFSYLGEKLSAAGGWLSELFNVKGVMAALSGLGATVYKFLTPIFDPLLNFFKNLWTGIWETIPDSLKTVFSGMKNIASSVASFFGMGADSTSGKPSSPSSPLVLAPSLTPSSAGSAPTPDPYMEAMAGTRDNVIPLMQQPGVVPEPTFSKMSSTKMEVEDTNTQALIDEIHQMSQYLLKLGDQLVSRPVMVTLQGDAKKFFRAAEQEFNNRAGARGAGS